MSPFEPTPSEPILRLHFRAPPRIPRSVLAWSAIGAIVVFGLSGEYLIATGAFWLLGLAVLGAASLPIALAWFSKEPVHRPQITLWPDHAELPISAESAHAISVPYRDLDGLFIQPHGRGFFYVSTDSGTLLYGLDAFERREDAELLERALRARVEAVVHHGPARVRRFEDEGKIAVRAYENRLFGTRGVIALIGVVYVLQHVLGAFDDTLGIVRMGANVRSLVMDGEVFRLVSANLLHGNLVHVGLNGVAIAVLGGVIERLFGTRHFLLVFLVSALFGAGASVISARAAPAAVGASTAAFGLLGAFAFTAFRYREKMPVGFRPPRRWWTWIIGVNVALTLIVMFSPIPGPKIDVPAHLGGFLGGVIVTALLLGRDPPLPLRGTPSLLARLSLSAVVVAFLLGMAGTVQNYLNPNVEGETKVLAEYVDVFWLQPYLLNKVAWEIAVDPDAPAARLPIAKRAAERANEELATADRAELDAVRDTLATAHYRMGELDEALEVELSVLTSRGDVFTASQVARFAAARLRQSGVLMIETAESEGSAGAGAPPDAADELVPQPTLVPQLRTELAHHERRGFNLRVSYDGELAAPITVYGLTEHDGVTAGLLRFALPAGPAPSDPIWLANRGADAIWPEGSTLRAAVVVPGDMEWAAWSMDPKAAELP